MTNAYEDDHAVDAETHATDWAGGFARLEQERGFTSAPATPPAAPPGKVAPGAGEAHPLDSTNPSASDASAADETAYDPDTATGASPGMASACHDLGLFSLDTVTKKLNIKPPGQA